MGAYSYFMALIRKTEVMGEVLNSLEEAPAQILSSLCREFEKTGQPAPDFHLCLSGYVGEVSLKALIAAGLVKSEPGSRLSIYRYRPTERGMEQYRNLRDEGFYKKGGISASS